MKTAARIIKTSAAIGLFMALATEGSMPQAGETEIALDTFGGRPVVNVMIGENGPYPFILDTGADSNVIDQALADEIGLTPSGTAQIGAPGSIELMEVPVYTVASISINGMEITGKSATGMDLSMLGDPAEAPRGVLSFWLLGDGVASLSLSTNKLTIDPGASLEAGKDGAIAFSYSDHTPFPEFEITLGGETLKAHLDTGSPGAITIPLEWKDRLAFSDEPRIVGKARLVGEERDVWMATLDGTVKIGVIELENPQITMLERIPGVNVGSAIIAQSLVQVDLTNKLIRISPKR